jgi:hypothetical protein
MEKKIFTESITRLESDEATTFIAAASLPELQTIAWWEEQVQDALNEKPQALPFNTPALFFHFSKDTEYEKGNTMTQKATGELTLHLVQTKTGKEGRSADETLADFNLLLDYADVLVDLLSGYQLPCSAKPIMRRIKRDHTNSPLMHEHIVFDWSGVRKRAAVPELP